jgi:hypothetical protein
VRPVKPIGLSSLPARLWTISLTGLTSLFRLIEGVIVSVSSTDDGSGVCCRLSSHGISTLVGRWDWRNRLKGATSVWSCGKNGRIQLLKSGLMTFAAFNSSSGRSISTEVIDDLLLETPLETSSGVEGGEEAEGGAPKKAPSRICARARLA